MAAYPEDPPPTVEAADPPPVAEQVEGQPQREDFGAEAESELAPEAPEAADEPEGRRLSAPAEACRDCRPPQGIHPQATSFTCDHGHWDFA
jgi:hypothetical protein